MFRVVLESSHALTANEEALTAAKQQLQETQSISSQMEIRLRQAREAEQAHRQLYPLAIMLSSVESNRGLVSALHRHGPAVLHVAAAHLFLIDGATGDLVSQSEDSSGSRHTADVRIPLHDSLLGAVAKSGEVTTLTSPATGLFLNMM